MHRKEVNLTENHTTPLISEIRTKQSTNEENSSFFMTSTVFHCYAVFSLYFTPSSLSDNSKEFDEVNKAGLLHIEHLIFNVVHTLCLTRTHSSIPSQPILQLPTAKYGVRSPKFIWAPCAQLGTQWLRPRNSPPPPRIWAHTRRYWSVKIHDISW